MVVFIIAVYSLSGVIMLPHEFPLLCKVVLGYQIDCESTLLAWRCPPPKLSELTSDHGHILATNLKIFATIIKQICNFTVSLESILKGGVHYCNCKSDKNVLCQKINHTVIYI